MSLRISPSSPKLFSPATVLCCLVYSTYHWRVKIHGHSNNSLSHDAQQLEEGEGGEGENGAVAEDGDEEEEEEKEEISKDSPMYVPKGIYFEHDSRSEEQDENEADK